MHLSLHWCFGDLRDDKKTEFKRSALTSEGEIIMAMAILAYTFGIIALAAAIKCFVDENWGEKMHHESESDAGAKVQDDDQGRKIA